MRRISEQTSDNKRSSTFKDATTHIGEYRARKINSLKDNGRVRFNHRINTKDEEYAPPLLMTKSKFLVSIQNNGHNKQLAAGIQDFS